MPGDYSYSSTSSDHSGKKTQTPPKNPTAVHSNADRCEDLAIPSVTTPRGDLGRIEQEGSFESWAQPDWASEEVIREVQGFESRTYDWLGPSRGSGVDMRSQSPAPTFDRLVRDQAQAGSYPTAVPESHHELMRTDIPAAAQQSLSQLGQDVHNGFDKGVGDYNIDEYSMILDQLPPGYDSPEAFLADFLRDPNAMANDQSFDPFNPREHRGLLRDFDFYNEFHLRESGSQNDWSDPKAIPGVGDWYHIDIPGNDGDVMIVDAQNCDQKMSATVATMTDDQWLQAQDHPVSGRRQFGMEALEEGGYRFYTRGFDRQTSTAMDPQASNMAQHADWSSLMRAMAVEHGGRAENFDEEGRPEWGWARQVPGEVLASSIENPTDIEYPKSKPSDSEQQIIRSPDGMMLDTRSGRTWLGPGPKY